MDDDTGREVAGDLEPGDDGVVSVEWSLGDGSDRTDIGDGDTLALHDRRSHATWATT